MSNKIINKVVATMLVLTLTLANMFLLGMNAQVAFATEGLEGQGTKTNNANVEFDAYFTDENGKKVHDNTTDITSENTKLKLHIQVKEGYLKNTTIHLSRDNGEKAPNFKLVSEEQMPESIKDIDIENNKIYLNQINKNSEVIIEIPINSLYGEQFDLNDLSALNDIKITGTYITNEAKEVLIYKNVQLKVNWTSVPQVHLEQKIEKYVPFMVKDKEGVILQTKVITGIQNNSLPIENTQLQIKVPIIDNIKPEQVRVYGTTTATNSNMVFDEEKYKYDEETGIITIEVENKEQNNMVSWQKEGKDEFTITYIFGKEVRNNLENMPLVTKQEATLNIKAYTQEIVTENNELEINLNNQLNHIVTYQIENTPVLYKGYLYNKSKETLYTVNWKADIGYSDLIDKIELFQTQDLFVTKNDKEYSTIVEGKDSVEYKTTEIEKENFLKILGEEGYIRIYKENGEPIGQIDKNTDNSDERNYKFTYEPGISNIRIETSKPITEGELSIQHVKAIKENIEYNKRQLEEFAKMQVNVTGEAYNETVKIIEETLKNDITLEEQTTKFEASINTNELSTVVKNKDVQIQVILNTNNEQNDLYKDPVILVELPSYVKRVELTKVELLYDTELNIANREMYYNEAGNIVIKITLKGTQTQYNTNTVTNGAVILMHADMTLDQLTPTKTEIVKVYVKNENATKYENTQNGIGYMQTNVQLVAPVGIVAINSIKNYNEKQEMATSLNGNINIGKLQVGQQEKTATMELTIINNYAECKNIQILGRTPFKGNKNISNNEELESTFTASMISEIISNNIPKENIEVYYSEKEDATKDLEDTQNGWTKIPVNLERIKSYLILLPNCIVEQGEVITFAYNIKIPSGLQHNEQVYSNYEIYYQNSMLRTINEEKEVAPVVGITTGEGPVLETTMEASEENEVQELSILTYTIKVKNNGTKPVQNVKVSSDIPKNTVYVKKVPQHGQGVTGTKYEPDYSIKTFETMIDVIQPGEEKIVNYEVRISNYIELSEIRREDYETEKEYQKALEAYERNKREKNRITTKATVSVQGYDTIFTTNEVTNNIIKGLFELSVSEGVEQIGDLYVGKEFEVLFKIRNLNADIKENVKVIAQLPKELEVINMDEELEYDNNTITWTVGKLEAQKSKQQVIRLRTNKIDETQKTIGIQLQGTCDGEEKRILSNEFKLNIVKPILKVSQTSDIPEGLLEEGDTIKYHIQVQNIGTGTVDVNVLNTLSEGLEIKQVEYGFETQSTPIKNIGQTATITTKIPEQKILHITVTAEVQEVGKEIRKDLNSQVSVKSKMTENVEANILNHYVIGKNPEQPTNPDDPNNPGQPTYRIAGTAWIDENKNGIMEIEEPRLKEVSVMLLNSDTGAIVKEGIKTDERGNYAFTGIAKGKYIVVFIYDNAQYSITEYKKVGIEDSINSDALEMKINVYGEDKIGGVTNTIDISTQNVYGINLGLVISPKFDLKLDKTVQKITVQNASGTKTYEYEDSKLAKVEINSKYVNSTNLIIEYKIKVTNEGAIPGYAKKIVDYLPQELKFNSELNTNWYAAENGYIYNTELANDLIQPGETREVTLILTKKMSEDILGIVNNTAEIQESYNDQGIADMDSTPANKAEGEDDISSADILLSLNTGEAITYTMLVIVLITTLGIGIYIINRKILRKI